MRLATILMSLAAFSFETAAVAQTAPQPWPREVQAVYDELKSQCATDGGKFIPDRAHFATEVEVTNDGKPDWVIEYSSTRCTTSGYSEWCGTAGCIIAVLGSSPSGLRPIYNDNVRNWKVVALANKRKGLLTSVHGTACGGFGADICVATLQWDGRKWITVSQRKNADTWPDEQGDAETYQAPPPQHIDRWQFGGSGAGAIAAVTGHSEFAAIGLRCQPGGGLYMTAVPKGGVKLPAAGRPLLLSFTGTTEGFEATQTLIQEPGKGDFSGTLAAGVDSLLVGRDSDLGLLASTDGGGEWQELNNMSLGGSTAAIRSLTQQCASAAGAAASAQAAGQKPVAPLGIVAGYYVLEQDPCSAPGFEAIYYDGKRLGLMRGGGAAGSLDENFIGPLGKAEKSGSVFFLPAWEMEVKILSPTRVQLTMQDTEAPRRWCSAEQIPAKWRVRP